MAKNMEKDTIDLEIVNDVLKIMEKGGLIEILVEQNGVKVQLKKPGAVISPAPPVNIQAHAATPVSIAASTRSAAESAPASPAPAAPVANPNLVTIKSPMVGTFYRAPSPDSAPFCKVGDTVEVGQTVCIIEAMKIMNEIKTEIKGRVREILVENAQAVEFNQPVILIEK